MAKSTIKVPYEYFDEFVIGYGVENFEMVEKGSWEDCGKFQILEFVVKDKNTGKFYKGCSTRSGSYFSDYEYMDKYEQDENGNMTLYEVERVPVTAYVWKEVEVNE